MKLGILIALAPDKKSGKVIQEPTGYEQAAAKYKALVAGGVAPEPGLPHIELWSPNGKAKAHKFRVSAASPVGAGEQNPVIEEPADFASAAPTKRAYTRRS